MICPQPQDELSLVEIMGMSHASRCELLIAASQPDEVFDRFLADATALMQTDPGQAQNALEAMVDLADAACDGIRQAQARRALARVLAYSGAFEKSLDVAHEASRRADASGHDVESARAQLASMHSLCELGRLDDAIRAGEQARHRLFESGALDLAARADINLGITYHRRDDPSRALDCFDRALPHVLDEPLIHGSLENSRGEVLVAINEFSKAETTFQEAASCFEMAGHSLNSAIAEGNLADLAYRQGRIQRALTLFSQARRRLTGDELAVHRARMLAEEADAHALVGQHDTALALLERSLPTLDDHGLALESARARLSMGRVHLQMNRPVEAQTSLDAAALKLEELGHRSQRAEIDLVRAELALRQNRNDEARRIASQALGALHDRPAAAARVHLILGTATRQAGEIELARSLFQTALHAARAAHVTPLVADILTSLAGCENGTGQLDERIGHALEAIEIIESLRGSLHAERGRATFLGERTEAYQRGMDLLLRRGETCDAKAAFAISEQARSRQLLDQVQRVSDGDIHINEESPVAQQWQIHRSRLNALYSRLADENDIAATPASLEHWKQAVHHESRELRMIESELDAERGNVSLFAATTDLANVQQRLEAHQVLVEYAFVDDNLIAFVCSKTSFNVVRGLTTTAALAEHLAAMRFQIARALRPGLHGKHFARLQHDMDAALTPLTECLIAPIASTLEYAEQLIIIPAGQLHGVPFHALPIAGGHLIDQVEIQYAPSASLLNSLEDRPPSSVSGFFVAGIADERAPGIEEEATRIARGEKTTCNEVLLGKQATVAAVQRGLESSEVAHLACHGRFDPTTPNASGLKLADRWLTVQEILQLRLELRLLVLSACESSATSVTGGDELTGLLRAFFAAGVRSAIGSLWHIDDHSTIQFMNEFYRRMAADPTMRLTSILRKTMIKERSRVGHTALWAPFILVGPGT